MRPAPQGMSKSSLSPFLRRSTAGKILGLDLEGDRCSGWFTREVNQLVDGEYPIKETIPGIGIVIWIN